jgi:hypothetical protein
MESRPEYGTGNSRGAGVIGHTVLGLWQDPPVVGSNGVPVF